jgi:hypothetical protein
VQSFTVVQQHVITGAPGNRIAESGGSPKDLGNELLVLIVQDDIEKNAKNDYRDSPDGKYQFGVDGFKHFYTLPVSFWITKISISTHIFYNRKSYITINKKTHFFHKKKGA